MTCHCRKSLMESDGSQDYIFFFMIYTYNKWLSMITFGSAHRNLHCCIYVESSYIYIHIVYVYTILYIYIYIYTIIYIYMYIKTRYHRKRFTHVFLMHAHIFYWFKSVIHKYTLCFFHLDVSTFSFKNCFSCVYLHLCFQTLPLLHSQFFILFWRGNYPSSRGSLK